MLVAFQKLLTMILYVFEILIDERIFSQNNASFILKQKKKEKIYLLIC